ncbi:MAG TPA: ABC transporter permease [Bacteroidales bacterium]|nr:ABC transporter permease [Bacteroidales bacterium]HOW39794.1 ABC transporter permease [Bacteroidales bacterium]
MNLISYQIRQFSSQRFTTIVNSIGMTVGFVCCIVIGLYVKNELSYDNFHLKHENIYRVLTSYPENEYRSAQVTYRIADNLAKNVSGVVASARLYNLWGPYNLSYNNVSYNESDLYYVDSSIVDIFTFRFLWGDSSSALNAPETAIVSRSAAIKYFGNENPIGKNLILDKIYNIRISAVVEDFPQNSHLRFSFLIYDPSRIKSFGRWINESWGFRNFYTYVLLSPNYYTEQFQKEFQNFVTENVDSSYRKDVPGFTLQKLRDIHLYSADIDNDFENQGSIKSVVIFVSIAVCILIIACINYVCLSISNVSKRSRDVGIRIIHGAGKSNIVLLYIGESVALSVLSAALAVFISGAIQPLLLDYAGFNFNINDLNSLPAIVFSVSILLLVSVVSGLIMSEYVIKHKIPTMLVRPGTIKLKEFSTSGIYVYFQFLVSIVMIICTIFIFRQLVYMQETEMGFNPKMVINISVAKTFQTAKALQETLLKNTQIKDVTIASSLPPSPYHYGAASSPDEPSIEGISVKCFFVDYNFIDFMGMKIIMGRDFSSDFSTDLEHGAIINRAFSERMKWNNPIGKRLKNSYGNKELVVIGVVENFHFRSFREVIEPVMICLSKKDYLYNIGVRFRGTDLISTLNYVRSSWDKFNPDYPFEYQFLDQKIENNYYKDKMQARILLMFSLLAITVSCLGLTATSSVYAKQRTKEIGIRKINGSRVSDIIGLLNRGFIFCVALAFLTAIPIAYIAMHYWLKNFAYRIELSWFVFILGGLLAMALTIITIAWQSWYVATRNPVEALRYE